MKNIICHPDRKYYCKGLCKSCYAKDYSRKPEAKIAAAKATFKYRKANPEKVSKASAKWRESNPEKIRKINVRSAAKWNKANPEKLRKLISEWSKSNPGKRNAITSKRRSAKLRATPKWADLNAIQLFYINCPKDHEVDHIIPLQSKIVCGLHVLDNLQYLTKSANCSKGNKYGK